jgi:hypothetical protein
VFLSQPFIAGYRRARPLLALSVHFRTNRRDTLKETHLGKVLHELHQKELKKVASLLKKGIRQKKFKKLNPYHLSIALGGLIDGFMFNWLENSGSHPYEADVSFITELFFNGCLAPGKPIRLVD